MRVKGVLKHHVWLEHRLRPPESPLTIGESLGMSLNLLVPQFPFP